MTEFEKTCDEHFMNNLVGLVKSELQLAQKRNRRIKIETIVQFIHNNRPSQMTDIISELRQNCSHCNEKCAKQYSFY